MLQVLDPAEETLPFDGRVRFEGVEDDDEILISRVETVREEYTGRLAAHRAGLPGDRAAGGLELRDASHRQGAAYRAARALYCAHPIAGGLIMLSLGALAFASPWLLLGLVALPVLWWLLRVTPPAPRRLRFPAIRLLLGLVPREETPARTPLWLILFRMLLAGLVILGLAQPLLNPSARMTGKRAARPRHR